MRISDWSSDVCSSDLGFDSFDQCRAAMIAAVPALGVEGIADYGWTVPKLPAKPEARAIPSPIKDFYLTNAICRASPTMPRCSEELIHGVDFAEAAACPRCLRSPARSEERRVGNEVVSTVRTRLCAFHKKQ